MERLPSLDSKNSKMAREQEKEKETEKKKEMAIGWRKKMAEKRVKQME
jgi:hypothetical protein